jgi:hypothetical protein
MKKRESQKIKFLRSILGAARRDNLRNEVIEEQLLKPNHPFIHQWLYSPLLGPGLFYSFVIFFIQTVGLLGGVISPSQGRYQHVGQHKPIINAHTDICALSMIRTYDPSALASEDSSCLR